MALNIPAIAAKAAATAFRIAASATTSVVVKQVPTATYDAATDVTAVVYAATTTIPGILYELKQEELEPGNPNEMTAFLEGRAKKLLILASDLAAAPTNDSRVEIAGVGWDVKSVTPDPVSAIYILQIRR